MAEPLWTPPQLTPLDHAFIDAVVEHGRCRMSADTLIELKRRLDDYHRLSAPIPSSSPIEAGVRLDVEQGLAFGMVRGPHNTAMHIDKLLPLITPMPGPPHG